MTFEPGKQYMSRNTGYVPLFIIARYDENSFITLINACGGPADILRVQLITADWYEEYQGDTNLIKFIK